MRGPPILNRYNTSPRLFGYYHSTSLRPTNRLPETTPLLKRLKHSVEPSSNSVERKTRMARKSSKPISVTDHDSYSSETVTSTSDIAALAYELWQQRGCPEGSPEQDWYEAERKVQSQTESQPILA